MTITTSSHPVVPIIEHRPVPALPAGEELADIHRRAGVAIAELSTGPGWASADQVVARLIADADRLAGGDQPATDVDVPAVVRCRELASAQGRLFAVLARPSGAPVPEAAVIRARALLAELVQLVGDHRATLGR